MRWYELDSSGLGWKPVEGLYEHGNERLGSIKIGKLLCTTCGLARRAQLHEVS
jgi:hypothetical protein